MASVDFGQILNALRAGVQANAARDTGPISVFSSTVTLQQSVLGNVSDVQADILASSGSAHEFIWAIEVWDDAKSKVT